jgi:hypothetical protein
MKIQRVIIILGYCLFLCFHTMSCKPGSPEPEDKPISFHKIYDNGSQFTYSGLDVKETGNKGYIVLGKVDGSPYLMRVNEKGAFLWDTSREDVKNYSEPVPELLVLDKDKDNPITTYVIICIRQFTTEQFTTGWGPVLLKFSEIDGNLEESIPLDFSAYANVDTELIKPLYAVKLTKITFLLMASNEFGKEIYVMKVGVNGIMKLVAKYPVSSDCFHEYPPSDERIYVSGLFDKKDKFFFQTYNSVVGRCFKTVIGDINGSGVEDLLTSENPFVAMEWYNTPTGDRRFSGISVSLETMNTISFIHQAANKKFHLKDVDGTHWADVDSTKEMYIKTIELEGESILFWGFNSNYNQIIMNAFDMKSNLRGWKFYGSTQVYELRGLLGTSDTELLLLGDTAVIGRMHRIFLIKLSMDQLIEMKNMVIP